MLILPDLPYPISAYARGETPDWVFTNRNARILACWRFLGNRFGVAACRPAMRLLRIVSQENGPDSPLVETHAHFD